MNNILILENYSLRDQYKIANSFKLLIYDTDDVV